jgi:hypothetical protein
MCDCNKIFDIKRARELAIKMKQLVSKKIAICILKDNSYFIVPLKNSSNYEVYEVI